MQALSKSKLMAYLQCHKRLWLELHHPELRQDSPEAHAGFAVGDQVGALARQLYDPANSGQLIDAYSEGFDKAFARSQALLKTAQPIFEAGFTAAGAVAFADVMLPVQNNGKHQWRMVEVKSTTSVKDYQYDDIAVQAFTARAAGVPLTQITLAHIDSSWTYQGNGDYQGLLVESDLTNEAFGRTDEVKAWIADAQLIASQKTEPEICTGRHCNDPYECGFATYCQSQEPQARHPASWLPRVQKKNLKDFLAGKQAVDLQDIPDDLLNDRQLRVKHCTLTGEIHFNAAAAAAALAQYSLPACFLDFETIQFAVPIWAGTRPYQQIPFQFSLHRLTSTSQLQHEAFLDLSGADPSHAFAEALINACGNQGPVFVYNASFETTRIRELAARFPQLAPALLAINQRVVDLLPIAEQHYYHPSQHGSWGIKKVLPAIAPDLRYDALQGVQDGNMAQQAFLEAIAIATAAERKREIEQQLLAYCQLDTYAMVRLWQFFTNQPQHSS